MLLDRPTTARPNESLDTLMRDYADIGARSRVGLRITPSEMRESYTVQVIGVIRSKRIMAMTAPVTDDGALVAIHSGQILTCRWFSATTAFRFRARIVRILFEPVPQVQVELPAMVERRTVRGVPRALANLRASLKAASQNLEAVIVDISTSGARLAVAANAKLKRNDELMLHAKPRMLNRQFELSTNCQIVADFGCTDQKHPNVRFFGVEFGDMLDPTLLVLHAFVQECLAFETDILAQVLQFSSIEVDDIDQ